MKLNKMPKDELESYSYIELATMIINEEKTSLNTADIFKKICTLLELSEDDYTNKIGDFYTSLTTDKNFVLLEDGTWDLRDYHSSSVSLDDEEDDDLDETEEEIEEEMTDMASEEYHEMDDDSTDEVDIDDASEIEDEDLTIIDEDELD